MRSLIYWGLLRKSVVDIIENYDIQLMDSDYCTGLLRRALFANRSQWAESLVRKRAAKHAEKSSPFCSSWTMQPTLDYLTT